jgi:arsenate reductase
MTTGRTNNTTGGQASLPAGYEAGWHLFGIPNCDTVKKARRLLEARGIAYRFHDWKKGVDSALIEGWVEALGWEKLVNRAGTTWRGLSDAEKSVADASSAIALMVSKPSLIRRPVLTDGQRLLVGFDEAGWQAL